MDVARQTDESIELEHVPARWIIGLGAVWLILLIGLLKALLEYEFSLEHLDSAEVSLGRTHRADGGTRRATSSLQLVFSNTRPATRVPMAGWSISGGGAGMLADTINDWLRNVRARNMMD